MEWAATAVEPSWVALKDEELLNVRIYDLGVRIQGSELERRVGEFYDELARPEYTVRFRWEPGSVAFWDNRATIHLAPSDHADLGFSRIMHRVMLAGDVPVGVDGKPSESIVGSEPGHW